MRLELALGLCGRPAGRREGGVRDVCWNGSRPTTADGRSRSEMPARSGPLTGVVWPLTFARDATRWPMSLLWLPPNSKWRPRAAGRPTCRNWQGAFSWQLAGRLSSGRLGSARLGADRLWPGCPRRGLRMRRPHLRRPAGGCATRPRSSGLAEGPLGRQLARAAAAGPAAAQAPAPGPGPGTAPARPREGLASSPSRPQMSAACLFWPPKRRAAAALFAQRTRHDESPPN